MNYKAWIEDWLSIVNKEGELVPFKLNPVQDRFLSSMTGRDLVLKARQQGFCLEENTPVLMADLTWRRVGDISVGEKVVATDEGPPGGKGNGLKMRTGVVEAVSTSRQESFRIVMDSGLELTATANHRFLTIPPASEIKKWRRVRDIKPGYRIRHITRPWTTERIFDDAYIAGVIDGEGSFREKKSGGEELTVTQVNNVVWKKVVDYANALELKYRIDWDIRDHRKFKPVGSITFNRMDEMFQIMGRTRPLRHINKHWWEGKSLPGKRSGIAWDRVVSIEPVGVNNVVDLQTSTRTFIANGYVSHNSSIILAVFLADFLLKPNTYNIVVADDADNASGLLKRVKDYLNYWAEKSGVKLKDMLKYNSKYELYFAGNNSTYHIGTAQNVQFGRSRTITNLHLSEAAFYPKLSEILAGAAQAVVPSGRIILETTANGFNEFKELWDKSKMGNTPYKTHFYPAQDFYSADFLKVKEQELGRLFKQEYPASDLEAFITSGDTFFSKEALAWYLERVIKPIAYEL